MKIELSERMQAVAALVPKGHVAADIGCDHGFVSIDLVQRGICPHVYAADIRKGPLERAKEHIAACGLKDRITAVLSDGLKDVPVGSVGTDGFYASAGEAPADSRNVPEDCTGADGFCAADGRSVPVGADGFIAAGMGGKLIVSILTAVPQKTAQLSWCVLSPQSEIWLVRQALTELGFFIIEENMVLEEGKYYPMMLAVRAGAGWDSECEKADRNKKQLTEKLLQSGLTDEACQFAGDWLGWQLMDARSEVLFSFLEHTIKTDEALLLAMPKPDSAQPAPDGDLTVASDDQPVPSDGAEAGGDDQLTLDGSVGQSATDIRAAGRILKRRTELEARIMLSQKVLEVLKN